MFFQTSHKAAAQNIFIFHKFKETVLNTANTELISLGNWLPLDRSLNRHCRANNKIKFSLFTPMANDYLIVTRNQLTWSKYARNRICTQNTWQFSHDYSALKTHMKKLQDTLKQHTTYQKLFKDTLFQYSIPLQHL